MSHVPLVAGAGAPPNPEKIFDVGAGAAEDSAFFIPKLANTFEALELGACRVGVCDWRQRYWWWAQAFQEHLDFQTHRIQRKQTWFGFLLMYR